MLKPVREDGVVYEAGSLVYLDPYAIRFTPWNPQSRNQADKKSLLALADSIADYGIRIPALIDEQGNLIDGNRRVLAARVAIENFEIEVKVPCFVTDTSEFSSEEIFAQVNEHRENIAGADIIELYLKNKNALPSKLRQKAILMEQALGGQKNLEELVSDCSKNGRRFTMAMYNLSRRVKRYIEDHDDNDTSLYTISKWLFKYDLSYRLTRAMRAGIDPELVAKRLRKNYPISQAEVREVL